MSQKIAKKEDQKEYQTKNDKNFSQKGSKVKEKLISQQKKIGYFC
jgi:hypothetical protein